MNFADCCTNELEFRICTNCKNIQYKIFKSFEKNVNVYYQRLLVIFFITNAFINVYYYFWTFIEMQSVVYPVLPTACDTVFIHYPRQGGYVCLAFVSSFVCLSVSHQLHVRTTALSKCSSSFHVGPTHFWGEHKQ